MQTTAKKLLLAVFFQTQIYTAEAEWIGVRDNKETDSFGAA